jgi:hypothetical protein
MREDGKIDSANLIQYNKSVKFSDNLSKTTMLALSYSFTQKSGEFDSDGLPQVESTTNLDPSQIFYKLDKLSQKLNEEILPINVRVRDIIGKFLYFEKLSTRHWRDEVVVNTYDINSKIDVHTLTPNESFIYDLRSFHNRTHPDYNVPEVSYNSSSYAPYSEFQKYPVSELSTLNQAILDFYSSISTQSYPHLTEKYDWQYGDDTEAIIGCPVVLSVDFQDITWQDLSGVTWYDLSSDNTTQPSTYTPYYTFQNIRFLNLHEIKWQIKKKSDPSYNFEWRGNILDLHTIPHFLPYSGEYDVNIEITDFFGGKSYSFNPNLIQVESLQPYIVALTNIHDKFDYTWQNLTNITFKDIETSTWRNPVANVINNEPDININLPDWKFFIRRTLDASMLDPDGNYRKWVNSTHPNKYLYGVGEEESLTWKNYQNATWRDLFFTSFNQSYHMDFIAGFKLFNPQPGDIIQISNYTYYTIPQFNDLQHLVELLNDSDHLGISLFHYRLIDYYIYASSEVVHKFSYQHITHIRNQSNVSPNTPEQYDYTFFQPIWYISRSVIDWVQQTNPHIDVENLFLDIPFSDMISGKANHFDYFVDNYYVYIDDEDRQHGVMPSEIDEDPFKLDSLKAFHNGFSTPMYNTIFFVVNSITGTKQFIWNIYNRTRDEQVIQIKDVPFLIWRFNTPDTFDVSVSVIDNQTNEISYYLSQFVHVYEKYDYINLVEKQLNQRIHHSV